MTSALSIGTGAAGLVVAAGAAVLMVRARTAVRVVGFRLLPGLAMAVWAIGTGMSAGRGGSGPPGEVWWSAAVGTLIFLGAAMLPARAPEPLNSSRLTAEIVLVASTVAMLTWTIQQPPVGTPMSLQVSLALLCFLDGALFAVLLLSAVRDFDRGMLVALGGSVAYIAGDIYGAGVLTWRDGIVWPEALAGAAGLHALATGLLVTPNIARELSERERPAAETRRLVVSTCVPLVTCMALLVVYGFKGARTDAILILFSTFFLISFLSREIVRSLQQGRLMRRLIQLAATDPMTGIGNRRALETALADLHAPPRAFSVMTLDLDGFKDINTLLGHHTGDALLIAVAAELDRQCDGVRNRPFRLGGDEFAVLAEGSPPDTEGLAERLLAGMPGAVATVPGANRVDVSASIGIAHHTRDDEPADGDATDLMADLTRSGDAMRAAKAAGRARVLTYSGGMARRQSRTLAIERRLRRRIADGTGLEVHFQPSVDLMQQRMTGMEALARWGHDDSLGTVTPAEFVPIAEDAGLITDLGLILMRRAVETCLEIGATGARLACGINVSPLQLRSPWFVRQVADLFEELHAPPAQFVVEVTESVQIDHDDPAVPAIYGLADLGLVVALDDFGAGYSSLNYLNQLPVRVLKLDKSITQRLGDPRGFAIARAVSDMARDLGVHVVAEGIETLEHLAEIRRLAVGHGQGWLFSGAVPPDRFLDFIADPTLPVPRTAYSVLESLPS